VSDRSSPATRLLGELIRRPSVNPMGRPPDPDLHLEGRVGAFAEAFLRDLGVRVERFTVQPGRDNILAWFEPPEARVTLLWDVHQDTVPVEGMTIAPFEPRPEGNRLYGRGACDVKGGLAAMLVAFERLVRERPNGTARVILACTVDEEFRHTGSSALAAMDLGADLAIVAEPTLLRIVSTHKGAVRWKVRTTGVACHSSSPWDGQNAIYKMAPILAAIEHEAEALAAEEPHPELGPPTLSVGRIEGGQSVNTVPDACSIEVDRRIVPGETPEGVMANLEQRLRERLGGNADFAFSEPWVKMPPLSSDSGRAWVEPVAAALETVIGSAPQVLAAPYGTDGGPLSAAGLPALVIGPGDIAQAHTKDEWIDIEQLELGVDAYFELAKRLGSVRPGA